MAQLIQNFLNGKLPSNSDCFYAIRIEDDYSYYTAFCGSLKRAVKQAQEADFGDYKLAHVSLYEVALVATEHTPSGVRPDWDNAKLVDLCPLADLI